MKKLKIIGILFILFVALFSSQQIYPQKGKCRIQKGDHFSVMKVKLNLTEAQIEAVEKFHFDHQIEMIDLKADLEKKKLEMKKLKRNGNYTRAEFVNKVKVISSAKQNIASVKANHKMDIYESLTEEQKNIFDKMGNHYGKNMKRMKRQRIRDMD
jgi:Spy/CpxP family protein refolding chaperone